MTTGVVTFDYSVWAAQYPELASSVDATQAQGYFDLAVLYCDNRPNSPVVDVLVRRNLLNMVTAHIAKLFAPLDGKPSPQQVGQVISAGEGTVNVTMADMSKPDDPQLAKWFNQTKYGAMFWAASAQYRTARYTPAPWVGYPAGFPFYIVGRR